MVFSLLFFAWGGVTNSIILIFSIIVNYFIGIKIEKNKNNLFIYSQNQIVQNSKSNCTIL